MIKKKKQTKKEKIFDYWSMAYIMIILYWTSYIYCTLWVYRDSTSYSSRLTKASELKSKELTNTVQLLGEKQ